MTEKLSEKRLKKIEELFRNPPPNSKTAEAKEFGVDLSLLIENMCLTPQERIDTLQSSVEFLERIKNQGELTENKSDSGFEKILQTLVTNKVDFIIIGEIACFVHGWKTITLKLEILCSNSKENLKKIVTALAHFTPRRRGFSKNSSFVWGEKILQNETNLMLETDIGSIDLLGEVAGIDSYEKVFANSLMLNSDVRVLSLNDLIKVKKAAGRPIDLLVLPELEMLRDALSKK